MSDTTKTFTLEPEQTPSAAALLTVDANLIIPDDHVGANDDPYLAQAYAIIARRFYDDMVRIPLTFISTSTPFSPGADSTKTVFGLQIVRMHSMLTQSEVEVPWTNLGVAGLAWWSFDGWLDLDNSSHRNYLLLLVIHYGFQFSSSVGALSSIFRVERVNRGGSLPTLEQLDRFFDITDRSLNEDSVVLTTEQAWVVAKLWDYPHLRELLLSQDIDFTFALKMLASGVDSIEDMRLYRDTMPAEVLEALTEGLFS